MPGPNELFQHNAFFQTKSLKEMAEENNTIENLSGSPLLASWKSPIDTSKVYDIKWGDRSKCDHYIESAMYEIENGEDRELTNDEIEEISKDKDWLYGQLEEFFY
jgi:hypothetical protein